ncbi:MAG: YecA family protein [Kofleriaceae bacterium]
MQADELGRPLGRSEIEELTAVLATAPGAMPYLQTHGFLTAIASAPTLFAPSQWQGRVLGDDPFASPAHAQRIFGLALRLSNGIITMLERGQHITPSEPDDVTWCAGYLCAARMDEAWIDDERGHELLFPIALLAGDVDLVGETDPDGSVITDPTRHLRRCRDRLETVVHETNRYFTAQRRAALPAPAP